MFTVYDVARGILKLQCKPWEFRATSYSVNSQAIIPNNRNKHHCNLANDHTGTCLDSNRNTDDRINTQPKDVQRKLNISISIISKLFVGN